MMMIWQYPTIYGDASDDDDDDTSDDDDNDDDTSDDDDEIARVAESRKKMS